MDSKMQNEVWKLATKIATNYRENIERIERAALIVINGEYERLDEMTFHIHDYNASVLHCECPDYQRQQPPAHPKTGTHYCKHMLAVAIAGKLEETGQPATAQPRQIPFAPLATPDYQKLAWYQCAQSHLNRH